MGLLGIGDVQFHIVWDLGSCSRLGVVLGCLALTLGQVFWLPPCLHLVLVYNSSNRNNNGNNNNSGNSTSIFF